MCLRAKDCTRGFLMIDLLFGGRQNGTFDWSGSLRFNSSLNWVNKSALIVRFCLTRICMKCLRSCELNVMGKNSF